MAGKSDRGRPTAPHRLSLTALDCNTAAGPYPSSQRTSEQLLSFILESQTSTLACGSNLVRWKVCAAGDPEARCNLCGSDKYTQSHVFAGCPWVNNHEAAVNKVTRFEWRHDQLVSETALGLMEAVIRRNESPVELSPVPVPGLLNRARD